MQGRVGLVRRPHAGAQRSMQIQQGGALVVGCGANYQVPVWVGGWGCAGDEHAKRWQRACCAAAAQQQVNRPGTPRQRTTVAVVPSALVISIGASESPSWPTTRPYLQHTVGEWARERGCTRACNCAEADAPPGAHGCRMGALGGAVAVQGPTAGGSQKPDVLQQRHSLTGSTRRG